MEAARTRILAGLCDVALVLGADTTPKGFLAPSSGDRPDDPDWLRFRLLGATNPTYFALAARRRMDIHGATDSAGATPPPEHSFKQSITDAAYAEAGVGPEDLSVAEVYDLSSALELDWYEDIGLCKPGEAERLLNDGDTTIGGRVPVNPSGGLACFGEAVSAQAIAQVCEVTWQLRGQATGRQVEGATVGVTANQGLFGHGSSVLLVR
jgi:acetyl-CoA acetyltransferase